MTNRADADFLQVLCREAWQDLFGNLVLAKCGLVLPKTEAPQPDHNVLNGAHTIGGSAHHLSGKRGCPASRRGFG
jgi:hypothetical protein